MRKFENIVNHEKSGHIIHSTFIFASILFAGMLAVTVLVPEENMPLSFYHLAGLSIDFFVCAALIYSIFRCMDSTRRIVPTLCVLLAAQLCILIGDAIFVYLELAFKTNTIPTTPIILNAIRYPIYLLSVLLLPRKSFKPIEILNKTLQIAIILIAAFVGYWNYVFFPLINLGSLQLPMEVSMVLFSYGINGLLLLAAATLLVDRITDKISSLSFIFLTGSFMITLITDTNFVFQSLYGKIVTSGARETGWAASYLLIGLASIVQAETANPKSIFSRIQPVISQQVSKLEKTLAYFPYVYMIAAYLVLIRSYLKLSASNSVMISIGVGCIIILSIILQIITFRENNSLTQQIHKSLDQAQQQALELAKINQNLQIEIGERKKAEKQLSHDALHDGLTGLPNRVLFSDRLERAVEYTQRRPDFPFSALFLDLDEFKNINDSLGHNIGDQLLKAIAVRLKECLRNSDTVARLGGDEFVILIENTESSGAISLVTDRIQEALSKPFLISGHELHITVSIGIVSSILGYENPDDVLRDADIAMYHAKRLGKARSEVFDPVLRNLVISRLEMENDLRQALDHGQFQMHYQPIIALKSIAILGFEALVRWNHPRRGMLLPQEFIQAAEESGAIIPIGNWILLEACTQVKRWQEEIPDRQNLTINVNISGKQFLHPGFIQTVKQTLRITGLAPTCLKMEITESVLIDNYEAVNIIFTELYNIGVQLEIDDFGTGYSSLAYLQHFPIQTIKIDKSFIQEIGSGSKGSDLVRTIIMMAHNLGMEAVAEGVETQAQLDELQGLMCQYGQGYLLSRPMDSAAAINYLKEQGNIVMEMEPSK
jgi:diguanylate cyclase (GGDEF)-like protein